MATMNISLPEEMKDWVEQQARSGRFGNSSDYVRDLIRRDQEAVAEFRAQVDDGLRSGLSDKNPDEIFAEARRKALAQIQALAAQAAETGKDAAA